MSSQIRTSPSGPETSPMFMPHRPERPPKSEGGKKFKLVSDYQPSGDQPTAIAEWVAQAREGERNQVLLGVTGSGKTFRSDERRGGKGCVSKCRYWGLHCT